MSLAVIEPVTAGAMAVVCSGSGVNRYNTKMVANINKCVSVLSI